MKPPSHQGILSSHHLALLPLYSIPLCHCPACWTPFLTGSGSGPSPALAFLYISAYKLHIWNVSSASWLFTLLSHLQHWDQIPSLPQSPPDHYAQPSFPNAGCLPLTRARLSHHPLQMSHICLSNRMNVLERIAPASSRRSMVGGETEMM